MAFNPFSTRYIRPGAIPFLFSEGLSAPSLVERLRGEHWWGQIIGPHGSGKSTLLATLGPELEVAGRGVVHVALHQGEHRLPVLDRAALSASTQLVIDGYEQLSWWSKWRVKSLSRRHRCGLLVTAHQDAGLPTVYCTQPSEELARAVVARLTENAGRSMSAADVSSAYRAARGNLRETLFRLYDVYQEGIQPISHGCHDGDS